MPQPEIDHGLTLADIAGCVAFLPRGLHMEQSGVRRTFGVPLRQALEAALGRRLKAWAADPVLQSQGAPLSLSPRGEEDWAGRLSGGGPSA